MVEYSLVCITAHRNKIAATMTCSAPTASKAKPGQ